MAIRCRCCRRAAKATLCALCRRSSPWAPTACGRRHRRASTESSVPTPTPRCGRSRRGHVSRSTASSASSRYPPDRGGLGATAWAGLPASIWAYSLGFGWVATTCETRLAVAEHAEHRPRHHVGGVGGHGRYLYLMLVRPVATFDGQLLTHRATNRQRAGDAAASGSRAPRGMSTSSESRYPLAVRASGNGNPDTGVKASADSLDCS